MTSGGGIVSASDGPAPAREAASVMLLKQPDLIYMTGRPTSLRVAGGFYVFPGGAVEDQDRLYALERPTELASPGLGGEHLAFVAAAVRETFEEVGLLFAVDGEGRALWRPVGAHANAAALCEARDGLNHGETTLLDVVEANRWKLAGEMLGYVARWVTPPAARRRFNTRFFVADVTDGIEPMPFAAEVAEGRWMSLSEVIARNEAGALPLMRPTKALIKELAEGGGTAAAIHRFRDPVAERAEVIEQNTPEVLLSVLSSQGVWMVPIPSPTLLPAAETNVFLVAHGGEAVLVDAGHGGETGVEQVRIVWERLDRPGIKALILTHHHPDHAGGVRAMQRAFGCPLWAHPAAADVLQSRYGLVIDQALHGGESIAIGKMHMDVLHAPGHSPDHLCLFLRERCVLFTGDNVVGEGSSWVGPPDGDMTLYLQSLAMLRDLPARVIAPGHGPPLDDPRTNIQKLIERRLSREADILRLLMTDPATLEQLTDALYGGKIPDGVMEMARRTVVGHLMKLEREGRVRRRPDHRWALVTDE